MKRTGKRLTMSKTVEILRLWEAGFNQSEIARGAGVTRPTVRDYVGKAKAAGITSASLGELGEERLLEVFGKKRAGRPAVAERPEYAKLSRELCRKGVTLQLLWQEYLVEQPGGLSYSQFCKEFQDWKKSKEFSLRREYRAGEYASVDYAGQTMRVELESGAVEAQIFVGVLCASNLIFAEAVPNQTSLHWLSSHVRMFEYFGGVPEAVVPDNLASGVQEACRYEPGINRAYEELAHHYGVAVIPARVRKPRDKAKVETSVQIVERHILAPLRNRRFCSFAELNLAIGELLTALNERQMKGYGCSRRELFERYEQRVLRELPKERFTVQRWKTVRVHPDYHVEVDKHYYSAPHTLIGVELNVRLNERTIELFDNQTRLAIHARSSVVGGHTTLSEHRPAAHTAVLQWTPQRLIEWAVQFGPETVLQVQGVLNSRAHPEQAYRSILGILRLGEKHGAVGLERVCSKANTAEVFSYQRIKALLQAEALENASSPLHGNVRGADYYH